MEERLERAGRSPEPDDLTTVITSLEPDQLSAAKAQYQCPRRRLTTMEVVLFWSLRIYLIFMVAVVVLEVWKNVH
jgi:hypothetical protein